MSIADSIKALHDAAKFTDADVAEHRLLDQLRRRINEELMRDMPQVEGIFAELRDIAARSNGLLFLFCLHASLDTIRQTSRKLPCFDVIEAACADLSLDYAGFVFQQANLGKPG